MLNPAIEALRNELATKVFDQGVHWRILFIGRSVNGTTDIVSCLSRSLRNLGHHVLDIDLKKHGNLTENPNKVAGGHGPIFIRIKPLEQLLKRFKPQMIISCAGGLTFSPAEADALKEQGIVLAGITLSDPDVFPSVHPHAHVFDFHTTNAHIALDMYKEKGIHNTLYFPFGIDRGFVTQQVAPVPELAADVICMGHATGRPERNALMTALARKFDVKTYGRGWEIPGSEPVAGERMVQAMRMGKIHINFPLTRAGYINIKCGVFESVGGGALLCTGRFREMETFFRYDDEIIGYESEEDLSRQLQEILSSPDRYRRITENAFRRLINEHLYEHRWMSLFETIYNISPDTAPWLSETRIAAIRKTLSRSYPRAKKVVLSGFYGASNLGDELILTSIRQGLERADQGVQVWVASENPQNVERDHGLQAFARKNHFESLQAVRTASAVVVGGGGLWHDYTFERSGGLMGLFNSTTISIAGFGIMPLLGRMFDLPYHVVGLGVGPLQHADAKRMVKFMAAQAETLYIRDEESADLLRQLPVPESKLHVAPDVVYALSLPEPEIPPEVDALMQQGYTLIGLNLRPWARMDEEKIVSAIATALRELARERRVAVVGIPMQAGDRLDVAILGRCAAACAPEVPMVTLPAPLTIERLTGTLSCVSALLSMRLHACLVAHRMRKPVVGMAYDPKVGSHFAELDRAGVCLPLTTDYRDYLAALQRTLEENGRLPDSIDQTITKFEQLARSALAVATNRIASLPTPCVVYEVPGALDAPPQVASAQAGTASAKQARPETLAAFANFSITGMGIAMPTWERGVLHAAPKEMHISLPTDLPLKGQELVLAGEVNLTSQEGMELAFLVESKYRRPQNLGRLYFEVQIGPHVFVEDLSLTNEPAHIRVQSVGETTLPIRLRLFVVRDCPKSSAWPRATLVKLKILHCFPLAEATGVSMYANRGNVKSLDEFDVNR